MIKFKCSICKSEVYNFYICKKYTVNDNYTQVKHNMPLLKQDREYLAGEVLNIVYTCKCEKNNKLKMKNVPFINDFLIDRDVICGDDLTQEKYGNLIVIRK